MKTRTDTKKVASRREFLKTAGLATGAAAAVTLATTKADAKATAAEPKKSGYRETEHVRTYYDLARF